MSNNQSYIAGLSNDQIMLRNYRTYTSNDLNTILNVIVQPSMNQEMWKQFKDTANIVLIERNNIK